MASRQLRHCPWTVRAMSFAAQSTRCVSARAMRWMPLVTERLSHYEACRPIGRPDGSPDHVGDVSRWKEHWSAVSGRSAEGFESAEAAAPGWVERLPAVAVRRPTISDRRVRYRGRSWSEVFSWRFRAVSMVRHRVPCLRRVCPVALSGRRGVLWVGSVARGRIGRIGHVGVWRRAGGGAGPRFARFRWAVSSGLLARRGTVEVSSLVLRQYRCRVGLCPTGIRRWWDCCGAFVPAQGDDDRWCREWWGSCREWAVRSPVVATGSVSTSPGE